MGSIIDGHHWRKERIGHLETALQRDDLVEGQREAIIEELEQLQAEQTASGRRRWWRFLGGPSV